MVVRPSRVGHLTQSQENDSVILTRGTYPPVSEVSDMILKELRE